MRAAPDFSSPIFTKGQRLHSKTGEYLATISQDFYTLLPDRGRNPNTLPTRFCGSMFSEVTVDIMNARERFPLTEALVALIFDYHRKYHHH